MREIIRLIIFCLLLSSGAASAIAERGEVPVVRVLMQRWLDAFNSKDIDALMALYSEKIYYANNGNSLERNLDTMRASYMAGFKAAPYVTINFSEELINTGETLAHIAGKYRINIPASDGSVNHVYGRVLLIFEKEGDDWKMIVDFDNKATDISPDIFEQ